MAAWYPAAASARRPRRRSRPGADRVIQVIVAEIQVIHDGERRGRAIDLGDRDRPVQRHHRRPREHRELVVQRHDLVSAGAAASAAPACTALTAAWIWYGPSRLRRRPELAHLVRNVRRTARPGAHEGVRGQVPRGFPVFCCRGGRCGPAVTGAVQPLLPAAGLPIRPRPRRTRQRSAACAAARPGPPTRQ
jgi:hypothetical protein